MKLIYKALVLFFCILIVRIDQCRSQDTLFYDNDSETYKIEWLSEFPSGEDSSKVSISETVRNFIFGKRSISLNKPISVMIDKKENLWIADQGIMKLIKVNNDIGEIPRLFNKKTEVFSSLVGLCLYYDNSILFTDSRLNTVYILDERQKKIKTLNLSVELDQPTGIAYSNETKELWVVETASHRILVFNIEGELIRRIGKRGKEAGEFNYPTFIWIDKLGTIYVVDSLNFRVQIFDKSANLISVFGKQGDGSGNLARPKGIAVDSHGNIYVADALFHVVQIFDKSGNFLYSFGSQGHEKGQFWMPTGIFIDINDQIYVADSYNSRIQVFKLTKD